jgi:hypothetical protein
LRTKNEKREFFVAGVRSQNFHCNETMATITAGSWTTPAEPTWIPEAASREEGECQTKSLNVSAGKFVFLIRA